MFKNSSKTSTKDYLEALQKRRGARQSESGSTACIKFDEPVPTENQLGRIPPKWNKYPTDSRPIRLYNRLKSLFADIPSM